MRADDGMGIGETILVVITAPVWIPVWACAKLAKALFKSKPSAAALVARPDLWSSLTNDDQRAVVAALIRIGRPAKNIELAELMQCSAGEASKRVTAMNGKLERKRIGREVRISIPHLPN